MKIEFVNIDKIIPYELNSKKHDPKQVDAIATAITRFGFDQPIVVDSDMVIIKGHGRRLASMKLGLKQVPVLIRSDLTPEQVKAARVSDNQVAIGDFDTEMLKMELASIDIADLRGIFDDKELEFLASDMTEMDSSLFVDDLDEAVASQDAETQEKFTEAETKRVSIGKALGFKDIRGADQLHVNRFMAKIEQTTNKQGGDAFVAFVRLFAAS